MKKPKILIIYTGGTIGMINDQETNMLKPFDFDHITKEVPELKKIKCSLDAVSFKKPIDSSWVENPPVAIVVMACAIPSKRFIPTTQYEIAQIVVKKKYFFNSINLEG